MNYKDQQKKHTASLFRDGVLQGEKAGGIFSNKSRPKPLPYVFSDGKCNLYRDIRDEAVEYFSDNKVAWWYSTGGPTGHALSSQISCLNHLFPIRKDKEAVLSILQSLENGSFTEVLPVAGDVARKGEPEGYIQFEAAGGERNFLNERGNQRGSGSTTVDALIEAERRDGQGVLVLIDWKFTESYDNKSVLAKIGGETRQSRYRDLIDKSELLKKPDIWESWGYEPFYQLTRQTLWFEQLRKNDGRYKGHDYLHLHVIPDKNAKLLNKRYPPGGKGMEETWKSCLACPDKYIRLSPERLLRSLGQKYAHLVEYLRARYWS